MSPRRMDISSLLRDPSPQPERPRPPPSLLSILNTNPVPPHRPPFLGLDALVHVASEERKRIASDRDPLPDRIHTLTHDHDQPHHRLPDLSPHRRAPDTSPRASSPFPSPSTRLHPSASPTNNYSTLRRYSILHMDPPCSAIDPRPTTHSPRTSPFLPSPHQLPTLSSPRDSSPQRHSPHLIRSQHYSSPIPSGPPPDSPRYGPKMAGGIDVLFNDTSSVWDTPRPDLSNYQGPGHDVPTERFASEPRTENARHDPPRLSPLSARVFSLDDDRRHSKPYPHQLEAQESALLRERIHSRPQDSGKTVSTPVKEACFPAQPLHARYPIRVWEEQPTAREISRHISPTHTPSIQSAPTQGHMWRGTAESGHCNQPASQDQTTESWQVIAEDVPSTHREPSSPRVPLASDMRTPIDSIRPDPQPFLQTLVQPSSPRLQPCPPVSSHPRAPTSPVPDLALKNFEIQSELQLEQSDAHADVSTSIPLPASGTIIAEEPSSCVAKLISGAMDTNDVLMANPLSRQSPELVQSVLAKEPEALGMSIHASVSQRSSRSPSSQPLSAFRPAEDEHDTPPEDASAPPEPVPQRSVELEYTPKQEPLASGQVMMDVDEELLSLVEDRPVRAVPARPAASIESKPGMSEFPDGPSAVPKGPIKTDEEKDRISMPPPAARSKKAEKDKTGLAGSTAMGSKKKKEGMSKSAPKPKPPPKQRAKPAPKPKLKPAAVDTSSKGSIPKNVANANSTRSRSASVIPCAADDVPEPEPDESDKEDDKLYCICKTRYDEDRVMIACDRCDEWFHTLCVNMPDLEIDLVDQFICPPCIQKHPHLRTTWKRRCLFGMQHENPSSPEACHKPSRGAFSKYCSDDCGIRYMRSQITQWEKSGGTRDLLWESVKNAPRREGVVVCVETNGASPPKMMDLDGNLKPIDSVAKRRAESDIAQLNARLEQVVKERELMKHELDMVMWREKVVELASERAGMVDECGWDQRLCFGEEEWVDFGSEVLESYEEERIKVESGEDAMTLDAATAIHGEWWCTGKKKCERHAGWQKLRAAEVSFDKETKEGILLKLTTREREIRKRIEDILYPQTGILQASYNQLNGGEKSRASELEGKRSL